MSIAFRPVPLWQVYVLPVPVIACLGQVVGTERLIEPVRLIAVHIGDLGAVAGQAEYQVAVFPLPRAIDHGFQVFHDVGFRCLAVGQDRDVGIGKPQEILENPFHVVGVVHAPLQRCAGIVLEMVNAYA
jgi:hypothetical protein